MELKPGEAMFVLTVRLLVFSEQVTQRQLQVPGFGPDRFMAPELEAASELLRS